jgi:hypothetical protein
MQSSISFVCGSKLIGWRGDGDTAVKLKALLLNAISSDQSSCETRSRLLLDDGHSSVIR